MPNNEIKKENKSINVSPSSFFSPAPATFKKEDFFKTIAVYLKELEDLIKPVIAKMQAEYSPVSLLGLRVQNLNESHQEALLTFMGCSKEELAEELGYFKGERGQARFDRSLAKAITDHFILFNTEAYCKTQECIASIKRLIAIGEKMNQKEEQDLQDALAQLFLQYGFQALPLEETKEGFIDLDKMSQLRKKLEMKFLSLFQNDVNMTFILFGRASTLLDAIGDKESIEGLVKRGVNFNTRGFIDNTPLIDAIALAHNSKAMLLLTLAEKYAAQYDDVHFPKAHYLDLNIQDSVKGNTALHLIIAKGHKKGHEGGNGPSNFEVMDKMLAMKANPNIRDKNGNTALHIACARREVAVIQRLIAAGADAGIENDAKKTPREMLELSFAEANAFMHKQTTTEGEGMPCHTLIAEEFSGADLSEVRKLLGGFNLTR